MTKAITDDSDSSLKQCNICQGWFRKTTFPPGRARCWNCHRTRNRELKSAWRSKLKHEYRISPEIRETIYEEQDGRCYFCDVRKDGSWYNGLVIDHDKDTGFVRGLLCHTCNANWVDEYKKLPPERRDSERTNDYLRRGVTGDYIEGIKQRFAATEWSRVDP